MSIYLVGWLVLAAYAILMFWLLSRPGARYVGRPPTRTEQQMREPAKALHDITLAFGLMGVSARQFAEALNEFGKTLRLMGETLGKADRRAE